MKLVSYLHITILLSLLALISSCTDEDIIKRHNYNIEEGIPVNVSLKYEAVKNTVMTRSAQSETTEKTINRLFAIAFYENGRISGYSKSENVNNTSGVGQITLSMHSGMNQRILIIANPSTGMGTLTIEQLEEFAEAGKTFEEFKQLYSKFIDADDIGTDVERMNFLMFGELLNDENISAINVNTEGEIINSTNNKINLERVDARITFKIKVDNSKYSDIVFTPKNYQVENVPIGTYIYPQNIDYGVTLNDDGTEQTSDDFYKSMSKANVSKNFDGTDADNMYFEFYLLENRLNPSVRLEKSMIMEGGLYWNSTQNEPAVQNLYALREKQEIVNENGSFGNDGQRFELGKFIYAPQHATYVIVNGSLTYTDENGQKVYADVSYKVHLGNTGNSNTQEWYNDEDLVNNYDTERNVHYTYTLTLKGVNSLVVEVEQEKEERPGAEGDVIIAEGEVEDMDAHYGRCLFTLTKKEILNGLSWAINTPFQRGLKVFNADNYLVNDKLGTETDLENVSALKTELNLNDYKWIQFVINAEAIKEETKTGVPSSEFAKYPGFKAYDGGNESKQAPAFGGNGYYFQGPTAYYSQNVKMYDVNQLLNHLYIEAKNNSSIFEGNGDDATVTITAFIDEYVYIYNPNEIFYRAPNTENLQAKDLALWKNVVNGNNRLLHICKEGAKYSPDGNTSLANSVITFSQRPIYTFYNPNAEGLSTAWGTESKMETEALTTNVTTFSSNSPNDPSNGRSNTLAIVRNHNSSVTGTDQLMWSEVLNLIKTGYGSLQSPYDNIWYACLGRNRDLDGDDIVEEEEIRWYLAAIDQLTDLWIGEEAVPNAVMYDVSTHVSTVDKTVEKYHLASSTYFQSSASNPWIIWAEEGASRGAKNSSPCTSFGYRCVRNLGIDLNDIDDTASDYVLPITEGGYNGYNEYYIDVSYLSSEARRSALQSGYLPQNNERDPNNRPYRKFAVCADWLYPINNYLNWENVYNGVISESQVCPKGYRIPNQRELMLMYTRLANYGLFTDDGWGVYMAKTAFSFNNYVGYSNRVGFGYDPNNLTLLDASSAGAIKIRCVRDVVD